MKPSAYYNENDPRAAAWLRQLIARGLIAEGDVDERSIDDVRPTDLAGYRQCHFFAGIGGWSYALRLAGWPDDRPVWTGSCPCQPFSKAGARAGFDDDRHLWPSWYWIIRQCRPRTIFGEQVAGPAGLGWLDAVCADLELVSYACGAFDLPAASVGAPHIRQRLWFVAESNGSGTGQHAGKLQGDEGQHGFGPDNGDHPSLDRGATGTVADHVSRGRSQFSEARLHGRRARSGSATATARDPDRACRDDAARRGEDGVVENSEGERHSRDAATGRQARDGSERSGLLDDAQQPRLERHGGHEETAERQTDDARAAPRPTAEAGSAGKLGIAAGGGRARLGNQPAYAQSFQADPWAGCDWIPCRDGKARPVEPGTFPLAYGAPARVGRLRGYGNAIVPQVAAAVIAAYMETAP